MTKSTKVHCIESDQPSGHEPTHGRNIYACPRCYKVELVKPGGVWAKHYGRDRRQEDAEAAAQAAS